MRPFSHGVVLVAFAILCIPSAFAQQANSMRIQPVATAIVNMRELSFRETLLARPSGPIFFPPPNEAEYEEPQDNSAKALPSPMTPLPSSPMVVSPLPVLGFEGAPDEAQGGGTSGFYNIPPDTYGAVGLDKVFTTLNNNYRILDKATGSQLSLVSMPSFWASLGTDGSGAFDPRVVFDSYNNRWILAAVSNGGAASSRVLLAISQSSDPQGSYSLFSFDPDAGTTLWADFPMLGYNKNWVAISVNLFTISGGTFSSGSVFVADYPTLRTGTVSATVFSGITSANGGFCAHPAETYSSSEATLYLVSHLSSGSATYKLSAITGTPAAPTYTVGATKTRTGGGWATSGGNIMPQTCTSGCPGTLQKIDPGDQFNRCNVVFRNGFVWYAQTIQLPSVSPTHTAVQWTKVSASTGNFSDGGRIEDPTSTATNGGKWYGHPSIAVNKNDDVLIGFTEGESDDYFDAGYAFRLNTDAAGTMQDVVIFKDGADYYEKDFSSGRQRWGDYSHAVVDPSDDVTFWTIQEYAKPRASPTVGGSDSKWGTWWAKVVPNACMSAVASGPWSSAATWGCGSVPTAAHNVVIISGQNVLLDADPISASVTVNSGGTLSVSGNRTLSSNLIVNGTLNLTSGKFILGANNVTLASTATLTGASSSAYFVTDGAGTVTRNDVGATNILFPIGPTTSAYDPVTINNAGVAGSFSAKVKVGFDAGIAPTDPSVVVDRQWTINEIGGGKNAALTFQYNTGEFLLATFDVTNNYIARHTGTQWVTTAATEAFPVGGPFTSTAAGFTSFSPFGITSNTNALPIQLVSFTGTFVNGGVLLNWRTISEVSNYGFYIQRNGQNDSTFMEIPNSFVPGHGTTNEPHDYSSMQSNAIGGSLQYRLKQVDLDGTIHFTEPINISSPTSVKEIAPVEFTLKQNYPNPLNPSTEIKFSVEQTGRATLQVYNMLGQLVATLFDDVVEAGYYQGVRFNGTNLASGVYLYRLQSGRKSDLKKLILLK